MIRAFRTRTAAIVALVATVAALAIPSSALATYSIVGNSVNRTFYTCTTVASYSDGIRWSTCTGGFRYHSSGAYYRGTNCVVTRYFSSVRGFWAGAC